MNWLRRAATIPFPYYALCLDPAEFKRELKKLKVPHDIPFLKTANANATAHTFENPKGETVVIVCMHKPKGRTRIEVYGLLVHEAMHIWQGVKRDIGEAEPSSEFEAYTVQFIAQELMQAYNDAV